MKVNFSRIEDVQYVLDHLLTCMKSLLQKPQVHHSALITVRKKILEPAIK